MTTEVDIGALPQPSEDDFIWAHRLWNTLVVSDETQGVLGGVWDMPNVGRYRRTGVAELTLIEIHGNMAADRFGITLWHKHDWIRLLADRIGWFVHSDKVEKADFNEEAQDQDEPALEDIGRVFACGCGMVYTLLDNTAQETRLKVPDDGLCLNPNCDLIIPAPHAGVLNAVNDTAVIAKMQAQEYIEIAIDEDEYPAPPLDTNDGDLEALIGEPFTVLSEEE